MSHGFPEDSAERKQYPITTGVIDYFTAALAEIAKISYYGNIKHNPGQELHWSRGKSTDQADTIGRHLAERGGFYELTYTDDKGVQQTVKLRHSASMAWRALALLQEELEAAGSPISRGSRFPENKIPLAVTANHEFEDSIPMIDGPFQSCACGEGYRVSSTFDWRDGEGKLHSISSCVKCPGSARWIRRK